MILKNTIKWSILTQPIKFADGKVATNKNCIKFFQKPWSVQLIGSSHFLKVFE